MTFRFRVGLLLAVTILAIGAFAVACGGGGNSDDGDGGDNSGSENGGGANEAQEIYIRVGCNECHGDNGEVGVGADGDIVIAGTPMIIQQFRTRVRNGKREMLGYDETQITEEEINLVYQWLKDM